MNQIDQEKKARKSRNIVLGIMLISFIILIYLVTIFKMGAKLFI